MIRVDDARIHIYIYIPVEHMAMIRSCKYGSGLTTLTATHPKVPPTRKVIPILTGMNHLIYIKNNFEN